MPGLEAAICGGLGGASALSYLCGVLRPTAAPVKAVSLFIITLAQAAVNGSREEHQSQEDIYNLSEYCQSFGSPKNWTEGLDKLWGAELQGSDDLSPA